MKENNLCGLCCVQIEDLSTMNFLHKMESSYVSEAALQALLRRVGSALTASCLLCYIRHLNTCMPL